MKRRACWQAYSLKDGWKGKKLLEGVMMMTMITMLGKGGLEPERAAVSVPDAEA